MISVGTILIGLLMSAAGILLLRYSYQATNFTGPVEWIEAVAGPGSTNGVYKLFGLIVAILGILVATGFGTNVVSFIFGPFRNIFGPFGK